MNKEQKSFVKYLIKASIIDIVRPSEIQKFINEGLFQCDNSIKEVVQESEAPPHLIDEIQCGWTLLEQINYSLET